MPKETEIKIRMNDESLLEHVIDRCNKLGQLVQEQILQRDEYYDTEDEQLKKVDMTIRLRKVGKVSRVAMKSARVFGDGNIHNRIELEFETKDELAVMAQLEKQNLKPTAILEKKRSKYNVDGCVVVIDILPFIGSFIEVEGPGSTKIRAVLERIGLSEKDSVKDNYSELLEKKLGSLGLPLRPNLKATFEADAEYLDSIAEVHKC